MRHHWRGRRFDRVHNAHHVHRRRARTSRTSTVGGVVARRGAHACCGHGVRTLHVTVGLVLLGREFNCVRVLATVTTDQEESDDCTGDERGTDETDHEADNERDIGANDCDLDRFEGLYLVGCSARLIDGVDEEALHLAVRIGHDGSGGFRAGPSELNQDLIGDLGGKVETNSGVSVARVDSRNF